MIHSAQFTKVEVSKAKGGGVELGTNEIRGEAESRRLARLAPRLWFSLFFSWFWLFLLFWLVGLVRLLVPSSSWFRPCRIRREPNFSCLHKTKGKI